VVCLGDGRTGATAVGVYCAPKHECAGMIAKDHPSAQGNARQASAGKAGMHAASEGGVAGPDRSLRRYMDSMKRRAGDLVSESALLKRRAQWEW